MYVIINAGDIMDIKLNITLKHDGIIENKEFEGTFEDNRIIYNDDVKVIIDLENEKIERISDDYKVELDFNNDKCRIYVKEIDDYLNLNLVKEKYEHKENILNIAYYIENEKENKIEYSISYKNM